MKNKTAIILTLIMFCCNQVWARLAPEAEPLALVHGCVNVITGDFVQQEVDLVLSGPSPLVHSRLYDSSASQAGSAIGYGFTRGIARTISLVGRNRKNSFVKAEEREGVALHYTGAYVPEERGMLYKINENTFKEGYTNYSPGNISGANDLHNIELIQRDNKKQFRGGHWELRLGCGTKRYYEPQPNEEIDFDIILETRPDGNQVHYEYNDKAVLKKVWLTTADSEQPLLSYDISRHGNEIITKGSNGQTLRYVSDTNRATVKDMDGAKHKKKTTRLVKVESDYLPTVEYIYPEHVTEATIGHLAKIVYPEGRQLEIDYYTNGPVKRLKAPVGTDATNYPIVSLVYKNDFTDVFGPYEECVRYLKKDKRVTCIQKYTREDGKYKPYSRHHYYWNTKKEHLGRLAAKVLSDIDGNILNGTYLQYDNRGNVTQETLSGNLTGGGSPTYVVDGEGNSTTDTESYCIHRSHTDIFNCIHEEEHENGLYIQHQYKNNTNLITARLQGTRKSINHREFFMYDNYANQIRKFSDDGSGTTLEDLTNVTVRTVTDIERVLTPLSPAFGKPSREIKKYWENGQLHLLSIIRYQYDERGYPIAEEHYDSQRKHRFTIRRVYDPAGRILEETNALGQRTIYSYDANGNRLSKESIEEGIRYEYLYDYSNRMIKETEIHPHKIYETTHEYDLKSRKIATNDSSGNRCLYTYDDLDRLLSITLQRPEGQQSCEKYAYDLAGNKTETTNALGQTTRTTYNARGRPLCISFPDGSQEHYQYNLDGSIHRHTNVAGVTTTTNYNEFLKPVAKEIRGSDLAYFTYAEYKGELLITETDANEVPTHFSYDGAGRLIEKRRAQQRTQYAYDHAGRQFQTTEWIDDHHARVTTTKYDLIDRVTEQCIHDLNGYQLSREQFVYDRRGNCSLVIVENSQGLSKTETDYDSLHRPIRITDALGNTTVFEYDDEHFTRTETDPLGQQTVTYLNSCKQIVKTVRKDALGVICACSEFTYDLAGRKIEQCDLSIAPGFPVREVITKWSHDSMGRTISITEAAGTPEQKRTAYIYNQKGQQEIILLPDHTRITHSYDGLGRLKRYSASDSSFDYEYEYDASNNILLVIDSNTKETTQRRWNKSNQMTFERLANGLILQYTYDGLGRVLQVRLPDDTSISYTYDEVHLKRVERQGKKNYMHEYSRYDLAGNLLEEETPLGRVNYRWDLLNRLKTIRAVHFTETIPDNGYDALGNLVRKTRRDPERESSCEYTYDALNQIQSESVTGLKPCQYVYDSLNNRRICNKRVYQVNLLNQLLSVDDSSYSYDRRGNLVAERHSTHQSAYTYDALGRLTSLTRDGEEWNYHYDAFNRRIRKSSLDGVENYIYLDQNEVGRVNAEGKIVELRVLGRGKGAEIGAAIALELGEKTYIPIHDHAGHISVLVDLETKDFAEGYVYSAFGEEQRYGEWTGNPWHFSSKRLDPESGWIYFGRRYYEPSTGRWTTPDPLGFADGPNLYAYVRNNPLTHFDLYGLYSYRASSDNYNTKRQEARNEGRSYQSSNAPSCVRNIVSSLGAASRKCASAPLRMISHLPVPVVRDAAVSLLKAVNPENVGYYNEVPSHIGRHLGHESDMQVSCVNGICNYPTHLNGVTEHVSTANHGSRVDYVYASTHGACFDILECGLLKAGYTTPKVRLLAKHMTEVAMEAKATGKNHLIYGHSRGGLLIYRAGELVDPALRQHIDVVTFGSAKLIPKGFFASAENFVARRDGVPMTDTIAYIKCLCGSKDYDVRWVGSWWGLPLVDHSWMGTYKSSMEHHMRGYKMQGRGTL